MSSEMLYPIIPLYIAQIGYSTFFIGVLEGVAECIAGLSKIYMGSLSDTFNRRLPFIQWGYGLSILSRPLIGISQFISLIFVGRSIDRIGKGVRSGARDALLADESTSATRGEIFGFHRSMDTMGAVIGPLIGIVYLYFYPGHYKQVFFISIIPGILLLLLTNQIKEKGHAESTMSSKSTTWDSHFLYYKKASSKYLKIIVLLFVFGLFNSSDMFLLLAAKQCGTSDAQLLMLYLWFNLVFTIFAYPIGKWSDGMDKFKVLAIGLFVYAIAYLIFIKADSISYFVVAFMFYGFFYAFTQGIIKAILVSLVRKDEKSSAIGFYEGVNSFVLLLSNSIAGLVYYKFGASYLFAYSAIGALLIALIILIMAKSFRA